MSTKWIDENLVYICGVLLIVLGALKLDGWPMWLAIIAGCGFICIHASEGGR